jgi:hypothetical protein
MVKPVNPFKSFGRSDHEISHYKIQKEVSKGKAEIL